MGEVQFLPAPAGWYARYSNHEGDRWHFPVMAWAVRDDDHLYPVVPDVAEKEGTGTFEDIPGDLVFSPFAVPEDIEADHDRN